MDSAQANDQGMILDRETDAPLLHERIHALTQQATVQSQELDRLRRMADERVSLLELELHCMADAALDASVSPAVQQVAWRAKQVARDDTPVLIFGEVGVGKEWLARSVHRTSPRAGQPFVKLNCSAIAASAIESELFGHAKGTRSGATPPKPGRFQIADGGTLLLDEVGELPLDVQAKLLRVLEDGSFFPVGSDHVEHVDVRIVASTRVDLDDAIVAQTFREDLFYRLHVFPLRIPPLRERLEDLPTLCAVLLAQISWRTGRRNVHVTPAGLEKLASHSWPGNLRELANVLERAMLLSPAGDLEANVLDLPRRREDTAAAQDAPLVTLDEMQRRHIARVLALTRGRIYGDGGAAKILGLKPSTLQSRMERLGMRRAGPRAAERAGLDPARAAGGDGATGVGGAGAPS